MSAPPLLQALDEARAKTGIRNKDTLNDTLCSGDATCRIVLAPFLSWGWRRVFHVSAVLCLLSGLPLLFVSDSPKGAEDTIAEGLAVSQRLSKAKPEKTFWQKVKPLLTGVMLYALCILSGVLYGTRTLFLNYSANYLAEVKCRGLPGVGEEDALCLGS
eukprot:TRINITY_DN15337_c0_g1_i5.p1 TRINITY_DN15337_c0_g1~~TRINITY_DN15337_c0_g1_i5.p1  ORF type:complete len:176 (-),score=10.26 TRINITY_DN15337_c0_g1_i5:124-600(-)